MDIKIDQIYQRIQIRDYQWYPYCKILRTTPLYVEYFNTSGDSFHEYPDPHYLLKHFKLSEYSNVSQILSTYEET